MANAAFSIRLIASSAQARTISSLVEEVIVDAAVLQLCRLTEVLCRGKGQPLFDKAVKADAYKLLSLFGFLFFPQNTIPSFLCIIQCFL